MFIKKSISSIEEIDGHIVYSRFQRYNKSINDTLLQQHLSKDINLAISLKDLNGITFEYSGKYAFAFGAMLYNLSKDNNLKSFEIIEYSLEKLVIYLEFKEDSKKKCEEISKIIELKLPLSWRILPNCNRPDNGNLLILPREYIENPWK